MKNILYVLSLMLIMLSCDNSTADSESKNNTSLGGEIVFPLDSYFKTEKPTEIVKVETAQINGQIFESLVKYNTKTLDIEPSLAEKWEVSEDGLTYTFYIRKGVYFHDNPCFKDGKGREMNPQDVVDMFYSIYTNDQKNIAYFMFQNSIQGGDDFYNGLSDKIEGITSDENTVTVKLIEASNTFVPKIITIAGSIIPKEALNNESWVPVGTGPFVYNSKTSTSEYVVLEKNKNYWMKDSTGVRLPYLSKLTYKYYDNDSERMNDFWDNKIAIVKNVPITKVSQVLEEKIGDFQGKNAKYVLQSIPQMATTYLEFNMNSKIMKDKKVRQAISLAINKTRLVEKTLKNQAFEIGKFGITPPLPKIYKNYDFNGIEKVGYTKNSMEAKRLLAEAGYPDGKGFPTLTAQFKQDNSRYLIMSEIQSQLRSVLNIELEIEQVEFNKLLENNKLGTADIFHNIWIGDFTSPESFLFKFYGAIVPENDTVPSVVNSARYINPEFDKYFEEAIQCKDPKIANENFAAAEKELMKNPPLVVLFYGENLWLKQSSIKNFYTNGMNYLDFTTVYVDNSKAETTETAKTH